MERFFHVQQVRRILFGKLMNKKITLTLIGYYSKDFQFVSLEPFLVTQKPFLAALNLNLDYTIVIWLPW